LVVAEAVGTGVRVAGVVAWFAAGMEAEVGRGLKLKWVAVTGSSPVPFTVEIFPQKRRKTPFSQVLSRQ